MRFNQALLTLLATAGALSAQAKDTDSKTPPAGPPWILNFIEARAKALTTGKPIFVYSTKTY
ncbi:MAG TPA: hypothetical protein VFD82_03730 [Planctomycetota bacterium]|nr:hypothetical protein [Planctomycetota bacterium]